MALSQPVAGRRTLIDESQLFLLPTDSSKVSVKSSYRGRSSYLLQLTLAWHWYCTIFTIVLLNLNKLDDGKKGTMRKQQSTHIVCPRLISLELLGCVFETDLGMGALSAWEGGAS